MEDHVDEKKSFEADNVERKEEEDEEGREEAVVDPELFSCLLQPSSPDADSEYVGIRRLLLYRKAQAGVYRRNDWRCNGKGYVAYRNFIKRPKNWENLYLPSLPSTPGQSGRWAPSPLSVSLFLDIESLRSSRVPHATQLLIREHNIWSTPSCVIIHRVPGGVLLSYSQDRQSDNQTMGRTSFSSSLGDNDQPRRKTEPAYSFVGMHCIFDQSKVAVTVLRFGHMSSELLAYGASDGSLTVCTISQPPSVIQNLRGHSKEVTDFDFSSNNQYIASSSTDKTVRVWEIQKGICVRVIYGIAPQLCIRFHPVNNNFLSAGNANKELTVFNFSTGRVINKITLDGQVTSMDRDHTGQLIFCGDALGNVYSVSMDSRSGTLSRSHRNRSSNKTKSAVTTVQYRSFSLLARGPVLLTCTQDGSLSFFSVALEIQGYLTLRCSLKLSPRIHRIRASFCPLLSLEKGEYIVSGSEDANVYFYDLTRPKHMCVNKLQGHGSSVIDVAWNHGENLLASSDSDGTVIVWKRSKTTTSKS